jgi:hypothetical protein
VKARWLFLILLACESPPPPPAHVALSGDVVAVVGDVKISSDLVASVAAAQHLTARQALDALVDDALASEAARRKGLETRPDVAWQSKAVLAKITADRIDADARAKGPPTDEEIEKATARRWRDFDVPEHISVIHAIVMKKKHTDPKVAADVANAIVAAVSNAPDANAFEVAAKSVDAKGNELRVERLPSFTADGRMVEEEGALDPTFVASSFALAHIGDTSTVVETSFGWHVIKLLAKLPGHRVPLEERRAALTDAALTLRTRAMYEATIDGLNGQKRTIDPAAESLMASVSTP